MQNNVQNNEQQYKPGDIANGHVLTETGQWLPVGGPIAPAQPKTKKPIYKRWWVIALVAIFVIGGISAATGGESDTTNPSGNSKPPASTPAKDEPKAEKPAAEQKPEMTASQENAVDAAEGYLDFAPFSKKGLIRQLSSDAGDGYPKADAVFAVNHIDVDWNAQAVKAAKNYLDMTSFSRDGLIQQLSSSAGDQYTHAQAVYAVNKVGL